MIKTILFVGKSIDFLWFYTEKLYNIYDFTRNPEKSIAAGHDLVPYGINLVEKSSMIFEVKACHEAVVILFERNENLGFQIIIGANNDEGIQIGIHAMFVKNNNAGDDGVFINENLLNCKEFRTFWYSWNNLLFRLGQGNITFENQIYQYKMTFNAFVEFNVINIYTNEKADGTWIIHNMGKTFLRQSNL